MTLLVPAEVLIIFLARKRAIVVTQVVRFPIPVPRSRHTLLKFSRSLYLGNQLSESIHTWTIGTYRVSFHSMTSDPRVHVGGGARGQNLVHLQKLGFLC